MSNDLGQNIANKANMDIKSSIILSTRENLILMHRHNG